MIKGTPAYHNVLIPYWQFTKQEMDTIGIIAGDIIGK